jgi:hypothetical protein
MNLAYVESVASHHSAASWEDHSMKRSALLMPVLLVMAATGQAQNPAACPQLPASAELAWEHRGSGGADFCRALRSDGSEAFGVHIASDSPFAPKLMNRDAAGVIDGTSMYWYRAELPLRADVTALETLIQLNDGRVAHLWLRSSSDAQLQEVMGIIRELRFGPVGMGIGVEGIAEMHQGEADASDKTEEAEESDDAGDAEDAEDAGESDEAEEAQESDESDDAEDAEDADESDEAEETDETE